MRAPKMEIQYYQTFKRWMPHHCAKDISYLAPIL
jgi:hypothetical protein